MQSQLAADYLALRPLLAQRVNGVVGLPVKSVELLGQLDTEQINQDCAFVLWYGDRFPDSAAGGRSVMCAQQWIVVLGVRNLSQVDKAGRDERAGPLLSQVHTAIAGWTPDGFFRPFRRVSGPRPTYRKGAGLYPLTFETLLNI